MLEERQWIVCLRPNVLTQDGRSDRIADNAPWCCEAGPHALACADAWTDEEKASPFSI